MCCRCDRGDTRCDHRYRLEVYTRRSALVYDNTPQFVSETDPPSRGVTVSSYRTSWHRCYDMSSLYSVQHSLDVYSQSVIVVVVAEIVVSTQSNSSTGERCAYRDVYDIRLLSAESVDHGR